MAAMAILSSESTRRSTWQLVKRDEWAMAPMGSGATQMLLTPNASCIWRPSAYAPMSPPMTTGTIDEKPVCVVLKVVSSMRCADHRRTACRSLPTHLSAR